MMKLRGLAAALAALVMLTCFAPGAGASPGGVSPRPRVTVTQVWSRPALAGDTGVVYATMSAAPHAGDRLIRVTSPVARAVELHESKGMQVRMPPQRVSAHPDEIEPEQAMMGMEMSRVTHLDVPAGGRALLSPGGYHVMLIGLRHALVAGETFSVTFEFERAGAIVTKSTVRM